MHLAERLRERDFGVRIGGLSAAVPELFPGSVRHDRFGIVLHEPFGARGASLLVQAAIARFYTVDTARTAARPQYPEIYLFHVGDRHGDHSNFDFWPRRKEVFVESDPYAVCAAILDRAITRLAVPQGNPTGLDYLGREPSGWSDLWCARELITSAFVYSPTGTVPSADITVRALSPRLELADSEQIYSDEDFGELAQVLALSDTELLAMPLGPGSPDDHRGWFGAFAKRRHEVASAERERYLSLLSERSTRGPLTQEFRRASPDEALGLLTPDVPAAQEWT